MLAWEADVPVYSIEKMDQWCLSIAKKVWIENACLNRSTQQYNLDRGTLLYSPIDIFFKERFSPVNFFKDFPLEAARYKATSHKWSNNLKSSLKNP